MFGFLLVGMIGMFIGACVSFGLIALGLGPWVIALCPILAVVGAIVGYMIEAGLMNNG